jgi:type I restriction enzyme R subunit
VPFVFSSNGDGFCFTTARARRRRSSGCCRSTSFRIPDELWSRYRAWKGMSYENERVVRFPYHDDGSGKEPRYYQRIAIQRVVEAVRGASGACCS